jgi:Transposase DDE domain group 1
VRLQLHALAYNLANFLRTLALPADVEHWSLTTLREKLVKIGARIVRHGRYIVFQLAEVAVPRALFTEICAASTDSGRGRFSHDRVALDTRIGAGEVCPESISQQPRRLG